jgi:hypothetical protein
MMVKYNLHEIQIELCQFPQRQFIVQNIYVLNTNFIEMIIKLLFETFSNVVKK